MNDDPIPDTEKGDPFGTTQTISYLVAGVSAAFCIFATYVITESLINGDVPWLLIKLNVGGMLLVAVSILVARTAAALRPK